ncbi:unnamed protein product [Closterium sp. NIES-53]
MAGNVVRQKPRRLVLVVPSTASSRHDNEPTGSSSHTRVLTAATNRYDLADLVIPEERPSGASFSTVAPPCAAVRSPLAEVVRRKAAPSLEMDAQWRDDAAVAASAKSALSGCSAAGGASVKTGGGGKKGAGDKKDARAISGGNGAKLSHGKQRRSRGSSAVGKCNAAGGYRSDDSSSGVDVGGCFRLLRSPRAKIATCARKTSAAGSATGARPGSATGVRPGSATGARPPVRGASADHFRFRRSRSTSHLDERRGAGDGSNGTSGRTENTGDGGEVGWGGGGGGGRGGGSEELPFKVSGGEAAAPAAASPQKRQQQQLSSPANMISSASPPLVAMMASSPRYPPASPHPPHAPHPPASPSPRQAPSPQSRLTRHLVSSPRLVRLLATSSPHHRTGHGQRTPGPPPSHNRRAARRAASATERDFVAFENLEKTERFEDFEVLEGAGSNSMYSAAHQSNRAVRRAWSTVERGAPRAFPATSPRAFPASSPSSGNFSVSPRFTNPCATAATLVRNTTVRHDNHLDSDRGDYDEEVISEAPKKNNQREYDEVDWDKDDCKDNDEGALTARPVQREGEQSAEGAAGAARGVFSEKQFGWTRFVGKQSPRGKTVGEQRTVGGEDPESFAGSTTPTRQHKPSPSHFPRPPPLTIHPSQPDPATSSSQSPASPCHSPTFPCPALPISSPTLPISSPYPPSVSPSKPPRFPTRGASYSVDNPGGERLETAGGVVISSRRAGSNEGKGDNPGCPESVSEALQEGNLHLKQGRERGRWWW